MRVLLFIPPLLVCLLSCASKNFGEWDPPNPDILLEQKAYRSSPCEEEKTKLAYVRMSMPDGCSECSIYFFRCKYLFEERGEDGHGPWIRRWRPKLKDLE